MKKLGGHMMQFMDLSITSRNMKKMSQPWTLNREPDNLSSYIFFNN